MIDIVFEQPAMDPNKTAEQNLATLHRWETDLAIKLNLLIRKLNESGGEQ